MLRNVCAVLVGMTLAACANGSTADTACNVAAGSVSGAPQVKLGTGAREYIARSDGDRWLAGFGQQGGAHLWLSFQSQGLGPTVSATYRMSELDGGVIYQGRPVEVCLSAAEGGGQVTTGILGFIDYTFPEPCSRILCGSQFKVSMTVSDAKGNSATDEKLVNGVDIGDTLDSTTPPDCAGMAYDPKPTCDGGLR